MASIATYARPALVTVALVTVALVPWQSTHRPARSRTSTVIAWADAQPPTPPIIRPGAHADARPWPHGMVMRSPADSAIDPHIVQFEFSALDHLLSVLLAPFRALVT